MHRDEQRVKVPILTSSASVFQPVLAPKGRSVRRFPLPTGPLSQRDSPNIV